MKKNIFMFGLSLCAALGMTSCAADEDMAGNAAKGSSENAITFSTDFKTRGGETLTALTDFYSYVTTDEATPVAVVPDGTKFTWDNTEGVFKSSPEYYWPTTGNLNFYAINKPSQRSPLSIESPIYVYTHWSGKDDLVAAESLAGTKQKPYPLNFKHLTSQISVSAESTDKGEDLLYRIKAIRLRCIRYGEYEFGNATHEGEWRHSFHPTDDIKKSKYGFTDPYSYAEAIGSGIDFASSATTEGSGLSDMCWNVLPVAHTNLWFEIEYQVLQNGRVIADFTGDNGKKVCRVDNPHLEIGKRYTYNLILNKEAGGGDPDWGGGNGDCATPIQHTVTIGEWNDGAITSVESYSNYIIGTSEEPFYYTYNNEDLIATPQNGNFKITQGEVGDINFYDADIITIDTRKWDFSNARSAKNMFGYCNKLTSVNLSNCNFGNVTSTEDMFKYCNELISVNLSGIDFGNVNNTRAMFHNCERITSIDLSGCGFNNVETAQAMFEFCKKLKKIDFSNCSFRKLTDASEMFDNCTSLTSIDLTPLSGAPITDASLMFSYCTSLTSIDLTPLSGAPITNVNGMFLGCSNLTSVDLSPLSGAPIESTMEMFHRCTGLTTLNLGGCDFSKVSGTFWMFEGCNPTTVIGTAKASQAVWDAAPASVREHLELVK